MVMVSVGEWCSMSVRAVLKVGCVVKHDLSFVSFVPVRVTSDAFTSVFLVQVSSSYTFFTESCASS